MKNFAYSFFNIIRDLIIGISIAILLPLISYYIGMMFIPEKANDIALRKLGITRSQKESILRGLESKKRRFEDQSSALVTSSTKQAQEQLKIIRQDLSEINQNLPLKTEEFRKIDEDYKLNHNINKSYKFYSGAILGIIFLIIGAFIPIISLSFGFIIGGIASLGTSYFVYWNMLTNILKLISLIIGVLILIALSFKFALKEKR
ncbi:hypothetical protein M1446_04445 [Candidatus Dependentiae bacterium]|nr:hypothetical protein [Candidatus Dependentiae bacterium]